MISVNGDKKRVYWDGKFNFFEAWNSETGEYLRSGVIVDGEDTDIDPFMRSYPNLLDVGIMGHCQHGKSGLCVKAGVQCYQSGLTKQQPNMSLKQYEEILKQSENKVMQIALGGRGDPNKHPQFEEFLKLTRECGIVPNYTTSGLGLTDKEVELTKRYCGAVAVSWYRQQHTLDAIEKFANAGCTVNIHYVLGNNSIDEAIGLLEDTDLVPSGVNAIVFLMHKPVGQGSQDNVLSVNDDRVKRFFELVDRFDAPFSVGFDSCSIPGILNLTKNINEDSIDTCEGSRYSAYITPDMKITPCSFDQKERWSVDLNEHTIQDAWNSDVFGDFRSRLSGGCGGCSMKHLCYGGCPITPEIVLCNKKE